MRLNGKGRTCQTKFVGKETRYIRIENSANTIHGYPISESEYFKLLR